MTRDHQALNQLRRAAGFDRSSGYVAVELCLIFLAHVRCKRERVALAALYGRVLRELPRPRWPH